MVRVIRPAGRKANKLATDDGRVAPSQAKQAATAGLLDDEAVVATDIAKATVVEATDGKSVVAATKAADTNEATVGLNITSEAQGTESDDSR